MYYLNESRLPGGSIEVVIAGSHGYAHMPAYSDRYVVAGRLRMGRLLRHHVVRFVQLSGP